MIVMVSGCANRQKPLYDWGPYEPLVYEYFKGQSVEKQIIELEKHAQKAKAEGVALPPGYQAHLGLLYSKTGRDDLFAEKVRLEETDFPESKQFFENMLNKAKKSNENNKSTR